MMGARAGLSLDMRWLPPRSGRGLVAALLAFAVAFTITAVAIAAAPIAEDDSATTKVNNPVQIFVLDNDSDPDVDALSITGATDPPHGTSTCSEFSCTYTPDTDYLGPDSFVYTVSDGAETDTATVSVTVVLNQPPVANNASLTTTENTPGTVFPVFSDPDGDLVEITGATDPPHGTVTCDDLSCTYTPDTDYIGPDSFDYTVSDGTDTDSATIPSPWRRTFRRWRRGVGNRAEEHAEDGLPDVQRSER